MGATQQFADLVVNTTWDTVADQAHEAKRSLLNFLATAIGSAHDPALNQGLGAVAPFSGPATSSLIGRPERLDMLGAAFLNAISANLLDYDDTHLATVIHPAAPVAGPILAVAEARGGAGRDVLAAIILGIEVECRIGNAVSPGHYARGWHITSTCGIFGAAAATARLLGLDAKTVASALGVAASQSAGIVENLPSAAKNVSVGNAARNGIFAALLAQQGYEAAPFAIEGKLGWARAMGDEPNLEALTGGLGASWQIVQNTYKPYPAGIVFHSVIDACLTLREKLPHGPDDIAEILVEGSALLLARGDREVHNERDARVSIAHAAACGLLLGAAGTREFAAQTAMDSKVAAFRRLVRAKIDPAMPDGATRVAIRLRSGETLGEIVMHARGGLQKPLTDSDLETKLRSCIADNGGRFDAAAIAAEVWNLDRAASIQPLLRLVRPA